MDVFATVNVGLLLTVETLSKWCSLKREDQIWA